MESGIEKRAPDPGALQIRDWISLLAKVGAPILAAEQRSGLTDKAIARCVTRIVGVDIAVGGITVAGIAVAGSNQRMYAASALVILIGQLARLWPWLR